MTADDATLPLVAAPPVPPVVPDSEALAAPGGSYFAMIRSMTQDPHVLAAVAKVEAEMTANAEASGSGVVPDKPALDPEKCPVCFGTGVQHCGMSGANCRAGDDGPGGNCGQPCDCRNASVPAVTDDEAATKVMTAAIHDRYCGDEEVHGESGCFGVTDAGVVLAALRSAGFLIVHHTKET